MRDRQKKMLRLLLSQKGLFHIEELAETFGVGKRTVSRDLDSLAQWLSLKGSRLDRKPGQGIQIISYGKTTEELLDEINAPTSYIDSLDAHLRQKLIILYLLYNNREVKISDMANTFFISDTSVWNDLNHIEKELVHPTLRLERYKGVGIQLKGDEMQIRLEFLEILTEMIPAKIVVPYLYHLKTDRNNSLEMNQLLFFLEKLNFPDNKGTVLEIIREMTDELGYRFTISGEVVLYFYLQLTRHRIKSGNLIKENFGERERFHRLCHKYLSRLVEKVFSGSLPNEEVNFLSLFISVLEVGSIPGKQIDRLEEKVSPQIQDFTIELIDAFGKIDNRMYYLNERIEAVLNLTVFSLITRLQYGIPIWHGNWGVTAGEVSREEEKSLKLSQMLLQSFDIKAKKRDLEYIILYFHSLFFQVREIPHYKIRCLVCCFEGIGLASYLQSLLQRELENLDIVEATAVFKIRQEYLNEKNIELVISTFPLANISTPMVNITLPLERDKLINEIKIKLQELTSPGAFKPGNEKEEIEPLEKVFAFDKIIKFIRDFSFLTLEYSDNIETIIDLLVKIIVKNDREEKQLTTDFLVRENLGSLFFEEYGIRVLHCKSRVIEEPLSGIIGFSDSSHERMLFLIAPDPCSEEYRKMLSAVTISFMENNQFRKALTRGGMSDMRRALMDVYKDMV